MKTLYKLLAIVMILGLAFTALPMGQAQALSTWDGTYPTTKPADMPAVVGNVQEVYTAAQFAWLVSQTTMFETGVNSVKLMADIDLANHPWTPSTALVGAGKVLDGGGYTISNLNVTVNNSTVDAKYFAAMFVGNNNAVTIKNVTIDHAVIGVADTSIRNRVYSAVLFSHDDWYGDLENVTVKNSTVYGTKYIGAIVDYGSDTNITNCTVQNVTINVNEKFKSDGVTRDLPHIGALIGLNNIGRVSGNTVSGLTINLIPVSGQSVDTTQTGSLIGTAQANVLVGINNVSGVTLNGEPYLKLIGLDNRTYKVINATQMTGYTTIQGAIDAAAAGDTILVGPGTYAELLTVDKAITLQGPNAAIAGDGTRVEEAVLTFPDGLTGIMKKLITVASDGVTIDGLKFQDKAYIQPYYPLHIYTISANNLTIKNNLFIGGEQPIYRDPYITGFVYTDNTGWLIENNKFVGGPFVNSEYARAMYIYKTGATIQNNVIEGYGVGIQILPATAVVGGEVKNNTIAAGHIGLYHNGHDKGAGAWSYSGNTITVAPNNRAENLNIYDPIDVLQVVNFNAVRVTNFGNGGSGDLPTVTFTNNVADLQPEATSALAEKIAIRVNGTSPAGSTLIFDENSFENYTLAVSNVTVAAVDASPNWWGTILGPDITKVVGIDRFTYTPWCGDAECSFLIPQTLEGDLQTAIDAAPNGAVIYVPGPATYSQAGGFDLDNDRLTLILGDGVVIQNTSPCFTVAADHVRILGESLAGAKCVPTNGAPGIYASIPVNDFVLDGIEIDGTGQRTGDGIWLSGGSDIQILNNYLHDLYADGLSSTAIGIYDAVTGVFDIRGNLFDDTAGIADPAFGTDAKYNSWGANTVDNTVANYACHPDNQTPYCEFAGTIIDFEPYTHVELFLDSSGTPWADQVVNGQNITYTVSADLVNITGAQFTLKYDPAKLDYISYDDTASPFVGITIDDDPETSASLIAVDEDAGVIRYTGVNYAGVTSLPGLHQELFKVTFQAKAFGTSDVFIDPATDVFGMSPDAGPSNNVYAFALDSKTVNAIALPTISSTDIQGYYLTGDEQEFHMSSANANGGDFDNVMFKITVKDALEADISSLKYWETWPSDPAAYVALDLVQVGDDLVAWWGLAAYGGFPMDATFADTVSFLVNFATAKNYTVLVELFEMDGTIPGNTVNLLADETFTAVVYNKPVLTETGLTGNHQDLSVPFTLNINNMSTMPVTFLVDLGLPAGTKLTYPGAVEPITCGATGCQFPVTLVAGANAIPLTAVFTGTMNVASVPVTLFDSTADPDRPLATATFGPVAVYNNVAAVLGTVSMQGRTARVGVQMTLTGPAAFPYGPYTATSIEQISNNLSFANVADGTYTITTNQPRYLNIGPSQLGNGDLTAPKTVAISASKTSLAKLELKGGNAVWSDNQVDILDAAKVGTEFGLLGVTHDGDVNFDGKINVQDLALVGGNYQKESNTVYDTEWTP